MNIVEKKLLTDTLKAWRGELELIEKVVSYSMDLLVATEKAVEDVFPDSVVYGTSAYFGNDDKAGDDLESRIAACQKRADGDTVPSSAAECEASAETEAAEDPVAVLYNGEEIPPFSEPGSGS